MPTLKEFQQIDKQAITITLAGLANLAARASTVVDNTATGPGGGLNLDVLVELQIKGNAAGVSATGFVQVYAYGTVDVVDSLYPDGITGIDAALTLASPTNLKFLGIINLTANAQIAISEPMSVASVFGGTLPEKWGIVVVNQTGAALDAAEANHLKFWQGFEAQSV